VKGGNIKKEKGGPENGLIEGGGGQEVFTFKGRGGGQEKKMGQ